MTSVLIVTFANSYDGENLIDTIVLDITAGIGVSDVIELPDYFHKSATLTLREVVPSPADPDITDYDQRVFTIEIVDGAVVGLYVGEGTSKTEVEGIVFENTYKEPITPSFQIAKTTNFSNRNGTFEFTYSYGEGETGFVSDPPVSITTVSGYGITDAIVLPVNFTGTVTVTEINLGANWICTSANPQYLNFEDGVCTDEGMTSVLIVTFANSYDGDESRPTMTVTKGVAEYTGALPGEGWEGDLSDFTYRPSLTLNSSGRRAIFQMTVTLNQSDYYLTLTALRDIFAGTSLVDKTFYLANGTSFASLEDLVYYFTYNTEWTSYTFYYITDPLTTRGTFVNTVTATAVMNDQGETVVEKSASATVITRWGGGPGSGPDPDPPVIILDDPPPLADVPDIEEIEEIEVPLADIPYTGNNASWPFAMLAGLAALGLIVVWTRRDRKKNEEVNPPREQ